MANIWNHICMYLWKYIRKFEEVSMFFKFSPLSQRNCLQTRFAQYCEPTGSSLTALNSPCSPKILLVNRLLPPEY